VRISLRGGEGFIWEREREDRVGNLEWWRERECVCVCVCGWDYKINLIKFLLLD
jgi:hypothetical protein